MRCSKGHPFIAWRWWEARPAEWEPLYRYCLRCKEILSLGPARDDGEHAAAVAAEVRAAELAWGKRRDFSADEWHGWDKHLFDGSPVENPEHQSLSLRGWVASRHAGYLARAIATHTEET